MHISGVIYAYLRWSKLEQSKYALKSIPRVQLIFFLMQEFSRQWKWPFWGSIGVRIVSNRHNRCFIWDTFSSFRSHIPVSAQISSGFFTIYKAPQPGRGSSADTSTDQFPCGGWQQIHWGGRRTSCPAGQVPHSHWLPIWKVRRVWSSKIYIHMNSISKSAI